MESADQRIRKIQFILSFTLTQSFMRFLISVSFNSVAISISLVFLLTLHLELGDLCKIELLTKLFEAESLEARGLEVM